MPYWYFSPFVYILSYYDIVDSDDIDGVPARWDGLGAWGIAMNKCVLSAVALLGLATSAHAGELHYTPVNPTFGGNPFNGPFLLGTANANNFDHLVNPATRNLFNQQQQTQQSTSDLLRQALVNSLISQASTMAINSILGTNGTAPRDSGTFSVAGETISFNRAGGQINITLSDPNGSQTQISVPVPQF